MKKTVKRIATNPLVFNSLILISGGLIANLFNFLFNLIMSRNLEVEGYGILISLISIITLVSVIAAAITPTIVTVAGKYFVDNDIPLLHALYLKMFKMLVVISVLMLVVFVIFSRQISDMLHINNHSLFYIASLMIVFSFFITLNNSFVQAKLSFKFLSFSNAISAFSKVFFGFVFVLSGIGLSGAISGYFVSFIIPLILGILYLSYIIFYKSDKKSHISYKELVSYGIPSAIVVFSLNAFISVDILLVKHLFDEYQAGQYAGLSLVARVIFYITSPVVIVMFPTIVNRYAKRESYKKVLLGALGVVGGVSLTAVSAYYFFSDFFILFFLKKEEYLAVSDYLFEFGIFITLYSLLALFAYLFLSIKKMYFSWILLAGVVIQSLLIYAFHNDFHQIIFMSTITVGILLFTSILLLVFSKDQ